MRFWKGHATGNDFVLLLDEDGTLSLGPGEVRALCARRLGIGADGVMCAVRSEHVSSGLEGAEWFVDYRNSDGSLAELCGNGLRLFARFLLDLGLASPGTFSLATRAGLRTVVAPAVGDVSVDLGVPVVTLLAPDRVRVSVGNPHEVVRLPSLPPGPLPGSIERNMGYLEVLSPARARLRVVERGSGETLSCGTGAVAAAAALQLFVPDRPSTVVLVQPGGLLTVSEVGGRFVLSGAAVVVAEGVYRTG